MSAGMNSSSSFGSSGILHVVGLEAEPSGDDQDVLAAHFVELALGDALRPGHPGQVLEVRPRSPHPGGGGAACALAVTASSAPSAMTPAPNRFIRPSSVVHPWRSAGSYYVCALIAAALHANIRLMTSDGSAYTRLRRAIQARSLPLIRVSAAELRHIALRDALGILIVIEAQAEERFEAAAIRWAGRLAIETPGTHAGRTRRRAGIARGPARRARAAQLDGARRAGATARQPWLTSRCRSTLPGKAIRECRRASHVPARPRGRCSGSCSWCFWPAGRPAS